MPCQSVGLKVEFDYVWLEPVRLQVLLGRCAEATCPTFSMRFTLSHQQTPVLEEDTSTYVFENTVTLWSCMAV